MAVLVRVRNGLIIESRSYLSDKALPGPRSGGLLAVQPCRSGRELLQGGEEVAGQVLEVVHHAEVAHEAEVQRPVVGDDGDPQVEVGAERHHREDVGQLAAVEVERELRSRHVSHDEVDKRWRVTTSRNAS